MRNQLNGKYIGCACRSQKEKDAISAYLVALGYTADRSETWSRTKNCVWITNFEHPRTFGSADACSPVGLDVSKVSFAQLLESGALPTAAPALVKLTPDYTAEVDASKQVVIVGCQVIPAERVRLVVQELDKR